MDKTERGKKAADVKWAKTTDRTAATAAGRAASTQTLNDRLREEWNLDPDSPAFEPLLAVARREHFQKLAAASAAARKRDPALPRPPRVSKRRRVLIEGVCPSCGHEAALADFVRPWGD